jgi:hypothetical protein
MIMSTGQQPRDDHGRFAQGNGLHAVVAPHAHTRSVGTHAPADGTSDRFNVTPHSGFMVGGAPEHGSRYTGRWTDPATGKTYVEKSTRANSGVLAKSLGRMRNQISVYDLARSRTVNTGGNGKVS